MVFLSRFRQALSKPAVVVELFIVANLAFLAVDIYVAHSTNQFAHWAEWIPFGFSLVSPVLLLAAYLIARGIEPAMRAADKTPSQNVARIIGLTIGALSICVGIAGLLWHLESQFFEEQTLHNLVYAAPFVAPLAYTGIGFLILLNRMVQADSNDWARWILILALGGWLGNFALSLADHAQNAFFYWPEWISVIASAIGVGVLIVAVVDYRDRAYLFASIGVMLLEIAVGVAGWIFHLLAVAHSPMKSVWERFVFSAPVFAPLLFANLALLAIIGLAALSVTDSRGQRLSSTATLQ